MWAAVAVTAVAAIGSAAYSANRQKAAQEDAKNDAKRAEEEARRAEVFAETEGKGTGQLGKISLAVDDEIDEDAQSSLLKL